MVNEWLTPGVEGGRRVTRTVARAHRDLPVHPRLATVERGEEAGGQPSG